MTVAIERTSGLDIPTYDIMVDVDDVMMPWAETVHNMCARLGLHDGSKSWTQWHMWEDYGCEKADWERAVIQATAEGLYVSTDPFPYAVEAVNGLLWRGHRVHIVTARGFMENGSNIRAWTKEWLDTYGVGRTTLTFAKDKVEAMEALEVEFDFAIDDGIHNYDRLNGAGVPVWMHTQPHNVNHPAERRVGSVWEFAQMIHAQQALRSVTA